MAERQKKKKTGCRLDLDFNCHVKSDKVLICPPGTERLDITLDKCAVEQKWQEAGEDKMPSAKSFFYLLPQMDNSQLNILYPVLWYESSLNGIYNIINQTIYNFLINCGNFILLHEAVTKLSILTRTISIVSCSFSCLD